MKIVWQVNKLVKPWVEGIRILTVTTNPPGQIYVNPGADNYI